MRGVSILSIPLKSAESFHTYVRIGHDRNAAQICGRFQYAPPWRNLSCQRPAVNREKVRGVGRKIAPKGRHNPQSARVKPNCSDEWA